MQRAILALGALLVFTAPSAFGAVATNADVDIAPFGDTNVAPPVVPGLVPAFQTCGATAPGTCTSGTHLVIRPAQTTPAAGPIPALGGISHGFAGVNLAGVTATLESKISWVDVVSNAAGARTFRCNVNNGLLISCAGSGTFPPTNSITRLAHTCASYTLGTVTPGGVGTYSCNITFTGVADIA